MKLERITVTTRDGYRGSQDPTGFQWRGSTFVIEEIVDRWYEGRLDSTRVPMRYFRVRTDEGTLFVLRHHELFEAWSLVVPHDFLGT